jgi:hypothetical protein
VSRSWRGVHPRPACGERAGATRTWVAPAAERSESTLSGRCGSRGWSSQLRAFGRDEASSVRRLCGAAPTGKRRLVTAHTSASLKCKLALTYPIIAISRSSKSWRRPKRRNDGKLNWRSCRRHTSSVSRIASRSCHLKYCLSTVRWYCTSDVYFCATHWINPIYYEFPACDCRCIRPRPRQDATIVWIAVVGYRQCCRLSTAGRQYDSCGCGSCCG